MVRCMSRNLRTPYAISCANHVPNRPYGPATKVLGGGGSNLKNDHVIALRSSQIPIDKQFQKNTLSDGIRPCKKIILHIIKTYIHYPGAIWQIVKLSDPALSLRSMNAGCCGSRFEKRCNCLQSRKWTNTSSAIFVSYEILIAFRL
jgi:hypothetical protein